ncbi:mechanosensitive ion channel family protein [Aquibium sp. A9E412]|uniref:mechanosensitive ion channel family protein n=1 Tax=Aquibium sp. A9E412 TaxID=2976767 RepID=UPI0025B1C51E|nr:mechanosensitive ion channel family protein [Aquibium sp. A9E412]MDN2565786.1 mechanosensitive ion channel family protein [Aquibium sp. A9E412]
MSARTVARRSLWPIVAVATSIAVYLLHPQVLALLQVQADARPVRLLSGSASYFAAAWLGGRLIGIALERAGPERRRVPRLLPELISAALFIAASIATIILVLGQSMSGALAGSGLVLAILGFAIRNALADVLSGIALGLEAPYRIGDWIEIDGTIRGRVVEIGWRTTRLLTRDSTYTILPNGQIARQRLTNFSAPRQHYRTHVSIALDHDVPVGHARRVLAEAAARTSVILATPAPDVRVTSYDADGIRYAVRFWVPGFADDIDCRDAVLAAIDAAVRDRCLPPPHARMRFHGADAPHSRDRTPAAPAGRQASMDLKGDA